MKIFLIDMPFSSITRPSIALTQLTSVVRKEFGERVEIKQLHLNHHFARDIGADVYNYICSNGALHTTGFGDWFFRQAAFPQFPDNTMEYFTRYQRQLPREMVDFFKVRMKPFRDRLTDYLDGLIDLHHIDEADLVGFTSMFFQTLASVAMAGRLKARNPKLIAVIGGANAEAEMGIELAHHLPHFDYIFSGPALVSFSRLISCLLDGRRTDAERVDGVFTRNNTRSIGSSTAAIPNPETSKCHQLDGIGLIGQELDINTEIELDYDSFLESHEKLIPPNPDHKATLLFETSRGCWWGQKSHCTFCGLNSSTLNYRSMQVDKALNLLHDLFKRYPKIDHYASVDNILPKQYISDLFSRLNVPAHISMFYEVKADLKEDDFKALARARVLKIQPGIEALSSSTLRLMRKGTTAFNNLQFLGRSVSYGIEPAWNLLIGFPGENVAVFEKYLKDLPLLTHLPPPSGVFPVRFDRFSPYFHLASEYKLDLQPLDFYSLTYPFPQPVIRNMAYYFYDNNFAAEYWSAYSQFVKRLEVLIAHWQARWSDGDNRLRPRLEFKAPGSNVVVDTRSGTLSEIVLNEKESVILASLQNPLDTGLLERMHPQLSGPGIQQTVESLTAKNLLFLESNRCMSLVLRPA